MSLRALLAACLLAAPASSWAAERGAPAPAWAPPFAPATAASARSVSAALASPAGLALIQTDPRVAALAGLDPEREPDRLALGPVAARLPEGFGAPELAAALAQAAPEARAALEARVRALARLVQNEPEASLLAAAEELKPFALYGPEAASLALQAEVLARSARSTRTMGRARALAAALLAAGPADELPEGRDGRPAALPPAGGGDGRVEVYVPPTREMRLWTKAYGPVMDPSRDGRLLRLARFSLVTPLAHTANLSLQFQAYLFDIFHTSRLARAAHASLMPLINATTMAALGPRAGLALALLLSVWYFVQGRVNRLSLLGLAMLPVTALSYVLGGLYGEVYSLAGSPWYAHPLLAGLFLAFLQAASHIGEPRLPPRVAPGDRWQSVREVLGSWRDRGALLRALRLPGALIFGMFAEWWASWRLVPINVLELLWRWGYKPAERLAYKDASRRALDSGDPALDFIGKGGGSFLPPRS